jgi:hypothetical protein
METETADGDLGHRCAFGLSRGCAPIQIQATVYFPGKLQIILTWDKRGGLR